VSYLIIITVGGELKFFILLLILFSEGTNDKL
jgi:hypothetical protein